jgi:tetratricopeptide (TPR) repeat protein
LPAQAFLQPKARTAGIKILGRTISSRLGLAIIVAVPVLLAAAIWLMASRQGAPTAKKPGSPASAPQAGASTVPAIDPEVAAEENRHGSKLYDERRFDEAVGAFDEAIRLDPKMTGAMANRAFALLRLGRLDAAAASANQALELSSVPKTRAIARLALGFIAVVKGQARVAESNYRQALSERPDYPTASDALQTLTACQHPSAALLTVAQYVLSGRILTAAQVADLSKGDLLVLAAAPKARHGFPFDDPSLTTFYYGPRSLFVPKLKEEAAAKTGNLAAEDQANELSLNRERSHRR